MTTTGTQISAMSTERDMRRIAELYVGITLEHCKADHGTFLTSCEFVDNTLWLKRDYRFRPQQNAPRFPAGVTECQALAEMSLSKCCSVIENGSGILAWLAEELPIALCEIDLETMEPRFYIKGTFGIDKLDNMKACHTVVKTTDTTGVRPEDLNEAQGIIADPTYGQYGFESGIDDYQSYIANKVSVAHEDDLRHKGFGSSFKHYRKVVRESYLGGVDLFNVNLWCNEARVRVVNNTTMEVVEEHGGRTALLALGNGAFQEAKMRILETVRVELEELRLKLEDLCWDKMMEAERLAKFKVLWSQCEGAGNQACKRATMDRMQV